MSDRVCLLVLVFWEVWNLPVSPWIGPLMATEIFLSISFSRSASSPGFVRGVAENAGVTQSRIASAGAEFVAALMAAADPGVPENVALEALREYGQLLRQAEYASTALIAVLERRSAFTSRGYARPTDALADLLGWDRAVAQRRVKAADAVIERTSTDGQVLPPRLPATAGAFQTGQLDLARVEVISTALGSGPARRISPKDWEVAEQQLADYAAAGARPSEVKTFARRLLDLLDQDGAQPRDDQHGPSWLRLTPDPDGGGYLRGRLNASGYAAVATAIDALSAPKPGVGAALVERQADALVDLARFALDHNDLSTSGGETPHLNVTVTLAELEDRARGALIDFGGQLSPPELRMLACDANVIPIVMGGQGQPLDVGRAKRTATTAMRKGVHNRDKGCAFPGCDRPPPWCDYHHVKEWAKHHGTTSVNNLVMLCRAHHRLCHHSDWLILIRHGIPEFIPPKWLDKTQTPRQERRIERFDRPSACRAARPERLELATSG
jgi:hypothetical protein